MIHLTTMLSSQQTVCGAPAIGASSSPAIATCPECLVRDAGKYGSPIRYLVEETRVIAYAIPIYYQEILQGPTFAWPDTKSEAV